ncbi:aldo/keto reductase [Sporosarcina sp. HYO08]|uniref:aldo/keto reductase n=1 Tax=Sporosarcina sp. HYO08 TaxID=1759557 RepID=UPI0007988B1E|nr:aldo/keto reductase [Sporosarcina sp. HYO08]KXH82068.1 oxidoreductase [Sporosarcina sp. HYO08]
MNKRRLGNSSLFVSELGLGCMSLPNDLQETKNIIDAAIDAGINFFDTADLYANGQNEAIVGQALKKRRHEIVLATKVGNKMNEDGKSWTWDASKEHIIEAVKQSLKRLGTDYIDLYQLHGGTMEDNIDETIDAFESLKQDGLIREYGISSIRPTVIHRFLEKSDASSIMMQYSLLDRRPEEWFPMIQKAGASVITRGTIAKGFLTAEGLERASKSNGFAAYNTEQLREAVAALANETDDLHAAAIAFVLREQTVATALIGARTTEQFTRSIEAYNKEVAKKSIEALSHLTAAHQYKEHRL